MDQLNGRRDPALITGRTLIRPAMGFLIDIQITQLFNFILKIRACPFSMYDVLDAKRRYSFVDNINMPFPMIESFPKLCDSHHSNSRHFSSHFLYRLSWWRLAPLLATRQALRQKLPLLFCVKSSTLRMVQKKNLDAVHNSNLVILCCLLSSPKATPQKGMRVKMVRKCQEFSF